MRKRIADLLVGLTAAGVLLSAQIHLDLWDNGFKDIRTIGPLFLLNAIGGIVLGVVVIAWRHWLPLLGAAGFGALTLAGFYLSVTRGLFGLHEVSGGTPQTLAEIYEWVALVAGLLAIVVGGLVPRRRSGRVEAPARADGELLSRW